MAVHAPFQRSDERWLGGVAAGLAHRLGIDPALIRSLFLLLTLIGGLGLILYGLGWLLLPGADGEILLAELFRGRPQSALVGAVVMLVIGAFRPFFWLGYTPYDSWYSFYQLALPALFAAIVLVIATLVLARRAARRRKDLAQPAVAVAAAPTTEGLGIPVPGGVPLPPPGAEPLDPPTIAIDSLGTEELPLASPAAPKKTWLSRAADPAAVPHPAPVPPIPKKPRPPRRAKAGSRHVQATLAANLLALAAIALTSGTQFSFRSIGQMLGATAIIWGASVAIAAARGRRAPGTSIVAALAALACAAPLVVSHFAPEGTMSAPIVADCDRQLPLESRTCAVTSIGYNPRLTIDDAAIADIHGSGAPLVLTSGIGAPAISIDTDEPLIITANLRLGEALVLLPEWTLELQGYREVLDDTDSLTDAAENVYTFPTHYGFRSDGETLVFTSPGAVEGQAAEIHIEAGLGDVFISSQAAEREIEAAYNEMMRIDEQWWQRQESMDELEWPDEDSSDDLNDADEPAAEQIDENTEGELP